MRQYPFSAIVGQEKAKRALLMSYINPAVGGALLTGEKGSGKSTLIHGAAVLLADMEFTSVPLNVTEDRLLGSLNLAALVKNGCLMEERGLLSSGENGRNRVLYLDEINLFRDSIVSLIITEISDKTTVLWGSMNPEEGHLRPQLLERFGLCAVIKGANTKEERVEIVKRRMGFERDPETFYEQYEPEEELLKKRLEEARKRLSGVTVSENILRLAGEIAGEALSPGNRTELLLLQTGRAIAAWEGCEKVTQAHLKEAAGYVLPHRMQRADIDIEEIIEEKNHERQPEEEQEPEENPISPDDRENPGENVKEQEISEEEYGDPQEKLSQDSNEEQPDASGADKNIHVKIEAARQARKDYAGSGKRNRTIRQVKAGHMIRSEEGTEGELAVCDTLKEAAFHKRERPRLPNLALNVKTQDFRRQVKEGRTGATILFVVDASGSMGAKRRMRAVKGAVLSLLQDAYEKRDKVGIVIFRGREAKLILAPTRSVDLARKCLFKLPVGGKTPLAEGLSLAYQVLHMEREKEKQVLQYLILLTDGKANFAKEELNPREAAKKIAEKIRGEQVQSMVLDTENSYVSFGYAKELAGQMGSRYESLQTMNSQQIQDKTKEFLRRKP